MSYKAALDKSWEDLVKLNPDRSLSVKFLADEYNIDLGQKKVFSLSCNVPAKDFLTILILHYLIQKLNGLAELSGEWLTFREFSGIEGYYPAFKARAITPIIRKYGAHPEGILIALETLPGKKVDEADVSIVLEAFRNVPVLIKLWRPDAEFGPEANILFDRSITKIFCTEDIVVLAGLVAQAL
ncbi:MAG TPA: DUF3786 domain-containing protein [Candidatus Omnitrophota bacterium]|nr:DUF3786 domain-containing protein [Candidatus Omnitrophota bacterium]